MENYQKVEQLVNKAGCSYEEARTVLESCNWDMIDAIIRLEREGKVKKETAELKTEEPVEVVHEVVVETVSGSKTGSGDGSAKAETDSDAGKSGDRPKREFRLFKRIKSILMNNRMVIIKSNGQQLIDVPILVTIIALILFFWATLGLALVAMLFGWRFHFEGEDLGRTNINNTMDKATDYAEKVKNDLTGKADGR